MWLAEEWTVVCGRVGRPDGLNVPMVKVEQSRILWFGGLHSSYPAGFACDSALRDVVSWQKKAL